MKTYYSQISVYLSIFLFAVLPVVTEEKGCNKSPDCPTLISPRPEQSDFSPDSSLQWTAVGGDDTRYEVSIDTGGVSFFEATNLDTTTLILPTSLSYETEFDITIRAVNGKGKKSKKCSSHSFTTIAAPVPPPCVNYTAPANGATNIERLPTVRWDSVDLASNYILKVGSAKDQWDIIDSLSLGNVMEFGDWSESFPFGQEVHVSVAAENEGGQTQDCQTLSFTIKEKPKPPAAPLCDQLVLRRPAIATNVLPNTEIRWTGASGLIHGYRVKIIDADQQHELVDLEVLTDQTEVSIQPNQALPSGTNIEVEIIPFNNANGRQEADNCQRFSFRTQEEITSPSSCPSITFPKDGATDVSLSDVIQWETGEGNPLGYRLQAGTIKDSFNLFDKKLGNVLSYPAYFLFYDSITFLKVTPYYANGEPELACEAISITVGSRPAGAPKYIRRNIAEMPPGHPHLKTYQEGVRQLKALDVAEPDNPFCWSKQSQIHGSGKCQHSFGQPNLYFLPWHRAYLFYLEEAIRTVTEREDFALPYWSWTQHPKIPKAFLGGETNPLWHSNRSIDPEETPWVEATQQRQVEGIQDNIAFGPFSRGLERSPHNFVHSGIGGDMQDPVSAASDPIFYCHHANVDRIWGEWNEDPDPQRGSNPNTQSWKENFDVPYTAHFFTRDKEFAEVQNRDLSSTRLPKLDYRYDTQKEVLETEELNSFQAKTYYVQEGVDSLTFSANTITVANTNTVIERRINVTNPRLFDYIEQASRTRPEQNQLRFVKVLVEGMKPPAGDPLQIRIFINCEYIDIDIPTNDPHYVSSFSFFESSKSEHQHHEGHQDGYRFSIDLTETLRKLRGTDSFPTAERGLDIQMVALPGNAEGAIRQYQPGTVKVGLVIAKAFLQ